jgi:hypothetical protein
MRTKPIGRNSKREAEISVGRIRYPRSAIFLNHWLIARTGEEVVARQVSNRCKAFADHDSRLPMPKLLQQVHVAAGVYRRFITIASTNTGPIDRLGLFGYRTGVLESEVIKPLVLFAREEPAERPASQPVTPVTAVTKFFCPCCACAASGQAAAPPSSVRRSAWRHARAIAEGRTRRFTLL